MIFWICPTVGPLFVMAHVGVVMEKKVKFVKLEIIWCGLRAPLILLITSIKGLGFLKSSAPPLSLLFGWDVMSEVNAVPKQWG